MQTLIKLAVFNKYLVGNNGERRKLTRNTLNFPALEAAESCLMWIMFVVISSHENGEWGLLRKREQKVDKEYNGKLRGFQRASLMAL